MTNVFRFTGVLILGIATIAAALSVGGSKAQAAGATISCSIPQSVVCDVSHPDGIANVTVTVDFGDLGLIDVVDKNFNCQKDVSVSWDPIVPNYDIKVTPCQGFDFKVEGRDDDRVLRGSLVTLADSAPAFVPMKTATVGFSATDTLVAPGKTMDICHVERDGSITVMTILAANWPHHDSHGDGIVAFHLPDGGVACLFTS